MALLLLAEARRPPEPGAGVYRTGEGLFFLEVPLLLNGLSPPHRAPRGPVLPSAAAPEREVSSSPARQEMGRRKGFRPAPLAVVSPIVDVGSFGPSPKVIYK